MKTFEVTITERVLRKCTVTIEAEDSDDAYDIVMDNYTDGKYDDAFCVEENPTSAPWIDIDEI